MPRPIHFIPAVFLVAALTLQSPAAPATTVVLQPAQIDQLIASIALYPDPLLAQILPASTQPLELAIAWQWLRLHPMPTESEIARQSWDPSIQALAHYPDVLELLAENLEWTRQVGLTYAAQRPLVNQSIQRLRAKARATGSLSSTPQQNVTVQPDNAIEIQPAEPDVIYVPVYDTADCFTHRRPPQFQKPAPSGPLHNPPATTPLTPPRGVAISRELPSPPIRTESVSPKSAPDSSPGYTSSDDTSAAAPVTISAPTPSHSDPAPVATPAPAPQPEPTATAAVSAPVQSEPVRSESSSSRDQNNVRSNIGR